MALRTHSTGPRFGSVHQLRMYVARWANLLATPISGPRAPQTLRPVSAIARIPARCCPPSLRASPSYGDTDAYSTLYVETCAVLLLLYDVSKEHWRETVEAAEPLTGPSMNRYCGLAKVSACPLADLRTNRATSCSLLMMIVCDSTLLCFRCLVQCTLHPCLPRRAQTDRWHFV